MRYTPPRRLTKALLAALLACGSVLPASAQDAEGEDDNDNGRNDRRQRFQLPDDATSGNDQRLAAMLERYPESDTDEDGTLTAAEARTFYESRREQAREESRDRGGWNRQRRVQPTHNDLAYGPHEKNILDLYLAQSEQPTPLVVFFHGGQFVSGDESDTGTLDVRALLAAGISVASIDYRETREVPFPAPFDDAAQAVQFLRLYCEQLNIDPLRIAGHGEEAGGNLALYLTLHDDLASDVPDPDGDLYDNLPELELERESDGVKDVTPPDDSDGSDPFADQPTYAEPWQHPAMAAMSTRLLVAVARHPIASFDPRSWEQHSLPMNGHERNMTRYLGVDSLEPLDDERIIALVEQVSPLALASADDPEILLMSQYPDLDLADNTIWTIMSHHPRQSQLIAAQMQGVGNRATVRYRDMNNDPGTSSIEFFIDKLR